MGSRHTSAAYRELGWMLCEVRRDAGLTAARLAHLLGWSSSTISRMENGGRASTTTDVIQYLVMCGRTAPEVWPIVEFARMAERRQGYRLSDRRAGESLQSLIFHESSAKHSIIYEPVVLHGLLQTPAYARALVTAVHTGIPGERVSAAVRTRMERSRILHSPSSARFTFFIHEQALRLRVGSDAVMREQLLHLVLTAATDNVEVRVVPGAAGERAAFGSFHLMEFAEHPALVFLDNLGGGGLVLDDADHVRGYHALRPSLAEVALDGGQSREFVADLADAHDRGSERGAADVLAQEQLQRRIGIKLRGGGVADPGPRYE